MECRKVREKTGKVKDLRIEVFYYPSVYIGLIGTTEVGKTHWIYSTQDRMAHFGGGVTPLDGYTDGAMKEMKNLLEGEKIALARTMRPAPNEIVPPYLFTASIDKGEKRLVLALCDVDGERSGIFGEAGKMRYLTASHGLVFIVDPLQIPSVRQQFGNNLPPDAPAYPEDQISPLNNLLNALGAIARPKYETPIAVVVSKGDVLRKVDQKLNERLWSSPYYQSTGSNPRYDMALHWQVQFAVRDFLWQHYRDLVVKIEHNFKNFAYFCMAPTGSSAKQVAGADGREVKRFAKFSPWRVEEPFFWIMSELGVIPIW